MMDGITILNTYEGYISGPGFSIIGLILACFTLALLILGIWISATIDCSGIICIMIAVITGLTSFLCFFNGNPRYSSYPIYDVTVDESVSLTEFNERYEILEQKGLIYTIKDRTE